MAITNGRTKARLLNVYTRNSIHLPDHIIMTLSLKLLLHHWTNQRVFLSRKNCPQNYTTLCPVFWKFSAVIRNQPSKNACLVSKLCGWLFCEGFFRLSLFVAFFFPNDICLTESNIVKTTDSTSYNASINRLEFYSRTSRTLHHSAISAQNY